MALSRTTIQQPDILEAMNALDGELLGVSYRHACKLPPAVFTDAFSDGQTRSKLWALSIMEKLWGPDLGTVFVAAGWVCQLAFFMARHPRLRVHKVRSFDICREATSMADDLNRQWVIDSWRFKAVCKDIFELDMWEPSYEVTNFKGEQVILNGEYPDLVINTACEHIQDFGKWWGTVPVGLRCVLQSNDFFSQAHHVNCMRDLEEFKASAPMRKVLFAGELPLPKYKRFMICGIR